MSKTNGDYKLEKVDLGSGTSAAQEFTDYNSNLELIDATLTQHKQNISSVQQDISSVQQDINLVYHGTSPKDFNSIVDRTALVLGGTADNAPVGSSVFWYIENIFYGAPSPTANHMQRATSYSSGATFVRVLHNGTWQAWRQMT